MYSFISKFIIKGLFFCHSNTYLSSGSNYCGPVLVSFFLFNNQAAIASILHAISTMKELASYVPLNLKCICHSI
jgi:hypothetical protein